MVAREEPTRFTRNRSVRVWILGVAGLRSQNLQPSLLTASVPLLAGDELVRSPEEDLRRQVPALFATGGAFDGDGLKREFLDAGRNVAAAPFTRHYEELAFLNSEGHGG